MPPQTKIDKCTEKCDLVNLLNEYRRERVQPPPRTPESHVPTDAPDVAGAATRSPRASGRRSEGRGGGGGAAEAGQAGAAKKIDVPVVGIDLGTRFTRVAIWRQERCDMIPNEAGNLATPSCVAFDRDTGALLGVLAHARSRSNLGM